MEICNSWDNLPRAMKGFKGQKQHFELDPEADWQPMQLAKQRLCTFLGANTNCLHCCILYHLKGLQAYQRQPQAEHITVVDSGEEQGLSDCEQSPLI